jgi:hypothetical protein
MHFATLALPLVIALPAQGNVSVARRMAEATKAGYKAFVETFRSPGAKAPEASTGEAKTLSGGNPFPHLQTGREHMIESLRGKNGPLATTLRRLLEERYDFRLMAEDTRLSPLSSTTLVDDPKRGSVRAYIMDIGSVYLSVGFPDRFSPGWTLENYREKDRPDWVAAVDLFHRGDRSTKGGGLATAHGWATDPEFLAKVTKLFPEVTEERLTADLLAYVEKAKQLGESHRAMLETPTGENAYALALDRYIRRPGAIESATWLQKAFAGQHTVFRPSQPLKQWVADWSAEHDHRAREKLDANVRLREPNRAADYERVVLGYLEVASAFTKDETDLYRVAHHLMREMDRMRTEDHLPFNHFASKLPKFRELMARDGKKMLAELRREPDLFVVGGPGGSKWDALRGR